VWQAFLDFSERVADGSSSAVQRCVEGSDGPQFLQQLNPPDRAAALALAALGRLLNDPSVAALVARRVAAEIAAEEEAADSGAAAAGEGVQASSDAGGATAAQRAAAQLRAVLVSARPDFATALSSRQQRTVLEDVGRLAKAFFEDAEPPKHHSRANAHTARRVASKRSASSVGGNFY
jgi:hypothetical protein